jgi:hypothetical protein
MRKGTSTKMDPLMEQQAPIGVAYGNLEEENGKCTCPSCCPFTDFRRYQP